MKTLKILALAVITAVMLQACQNPEGEKSKTTGAEKVSESDGMTFKINTEKSKLKWLGTKPTGKHWGYLPLQKGQLKVKDGMISSGKFTMNLAGIIVKDPPPEKEKRNKKLENHLKSPDFFNTDTFPTSTFKLTGIEEINATPEDSMKLTHKISGNLTIKDITKNISFKAKINLKDN